MIAALLGLTVCLGAALQTEGAQDTSSVEASADKSKTADAAPVVEDRVRLLVMDLSAEGAEQKLAASLSQAIATQAGNYKGYEVISTEEIRALLDAEAAKELAGCDGDSCLAEIASALDADLVVAGTTRVQEGTRWITLSLLNTRAVITINRVNLLWAGDEGALLDVAATGAQLLLLDKDRRPPGGFVLQGAPDDLVVYVDDEEEPAKVDEGKINAVDVGPHRLSLSAPGYQNRVIYALARSDTMSVVNVELEPTPLWQQWWVWTTAGLAVVSVAAIAAFTAAVNSPADAQTVATIRAPGINDVERVKDGTP